MPEVEIIATIDAVAAAEWDALIFPGIERHGYLRAIERSGMTGFAWRYVVVREHGRLVAAAPAFVTDYAIDTTIGPEHARLTHTLRRFFPRLMTQRMAALGSPCTETLTMGFAAGLDVDRRRAAAMLLLDGLDRIARDDSATIIVAKDVPGCDGVLLAPLLGARGASPMPSLPVASLPIDFATIDEYLARLSPGTRRDMRRKLRAREQVRIERVRDVTPVIDRIMTLYRQTRERAGLKFEELTPAYFTGLLGELAGRSFATLYWRGDDLVAINLLLEEEGLLLDKYFCMDAEHGRPLSLYFLSWFDNLEYCLDRHLVRYQAGQAAYANKLRLGCGLEPTTIWFRHRNALLNRMLNRAAPLLASGMPERDAA